MTDPVDVQPVRLVTGDAPAPVPAPEAGLDLPLVPVAIIFMLTVVLAATTVFLRWRLRTPPAERAMLAAALRLRLHRADRAAVRRLARLAGIPEPVALLLSPGAMDRALHAHAGAMDPQRVERLRSLVVNAP